MSDPANSERARCPWCGQPAEVVQVHGHGQCRHCGINIDPCCGGETCDPTPSQEPPASAEKPDETTSG